MSHGGKSTAELPPIATLLTPEERLRVDAAGEGCYRTLHRESVDDVIRDLFTYYRPGVEVVEPTA